MVVPQNYLNVNKKMNQKAAEFFFSKPIIDMLKTRFDGIACGLQLYLIYGTKLWRAFMDREIPMEERLFLAGEVCLFCYFGGIVLKRKNKIYSLLEIQ